MPLRSLSRLTLPLMFVLCVILIILSSCGRSSDPVIPVDETIEYRWTTEYVYPGGNLLNDIHGSTTGDIFVVGNSGVILSSDGTDWTVSPSGTDMNLMSVYGLSGNFPRARPDRAGFIFRISSRYGPAGRKPSSPG